MFKVILISCLLGEIATCVESTRNSKKPRDKYHARKVSKSALSLVREYLSVLVYQLSQLPVFWSNWSSSVDSEKVLLPTIRISLILAKSPSITVNDRFTRLRSAGVMVVMISAPYKLRLTYWRFNSCSARSAKALSKGRPSANPISRKALRKTSLSNSLVPMKSTCAILGRSSTINTNTLPLTSMRTSLKRPKANKLRMADAPFSSV